MNTTTASNHRRCRPGVQIVRAVILSWILALAGFVLAQPSKPTIVSSDKRPSTSSQPGSVGVPLQQQPSAEVDMIQSIHNVTSSTNVDNKANELTHHWWIEPDWWLVVLTAILSWVTWRLVVHTRQLAVDAGATSKRQAEETASAPAIAKEANRISNEVAIASRRAWVSIETVKLKHPARFGEDGIVWSVEVTIKNVGLTPATCVDIKMDSWFSNSSGTFKEAEAIFKKSLKSHPVQLGDMLFPTDTLVERLTWAEGADKVGDGLTTRPDGEKLLGCFMFIGVTYRINGDEAAHITYRPHHMQNVPVGTEVAVGQSIDLPRDPFLAGEAN